MATFRDVLLISEDYIKSTSNISDNTAGDYILPAIKLAQDIELEETLGTALVHKLQQLVFSNQVEVEGNEYYADLLNNYVQPFLCYTVISNLTLQISFKLNNFGVSRTDDEKQYSVSFSEVGQVKNYYKHYANYYKFRMQLYVVENYSQFPELLSYKGIEDLRQNLYSAAGCPIWLGGARSKSFYPINKGDYLKYKYNFPSSNNKK